MREVQRVVKQSFNAKLHVVILILCLGGLFGSTIYAYLRAEEAVNADHKPEKVEAIKQYFTDTSTEQFILPYIYIHGVVEVDGLTYSQCNESMIINVALDVLNLPLPSNNKAQHNIMTMNEQQTLDFFRMRVPMEEMEYELWMQDWYQDNYGWVPDEFTNVDIATYTHLENTIGYVPYGFYPRYTDDNGTLYTVSEIRVQAWQDSAQWAWHFLIKMIWENPPLELDTLTLHIGYTTKDAFCTLFHESHVWHLCVNSLLSLHFSNVDYFEVPHKDVVSQMYDTEGWCIIPKLTHDELHKREAIINVEKETHNGVSFWSARSTLDFTEINPQIDKVGEYELRIFVNSLVEQWVEYSEYEYTDAFAFIGSVYTAMWSILLFVSGYLVWCGKYKDRGLLSMLDPSEGNREEIEYLEGVTLKWLSILTGKARDEGFLAGEDLERQYITYLDKEHISVRRKIDMMILQLERDKTANQNEIEMETFVGRESNFESS